MTLQNNDQQEYDNKPGTYNIYYWKGWGICLIVQIQLFPLVKDVSPL